MNATDTADLNTMTAASVQATEAVDDAERKIVTFLLGKQTFGIDMSALIEIREWEDPTPLPSVPAYIKGVTNLRGHVVPVVGLAERLGWEPSVLHARSCILVVNIGGKHAGFLVDEVTETSVIRGLVEIGQRSQDSSDNKHQIMVSLLDLEKLSPTRHLDLVA